MSHATIEDKKTVAMNEAKARDLQAKIAALLNIEKVPKFNQAIRLSINSLPGCQRMHRTTANRRKRSASLATIPETAGRGQRSPG